MALIVSLSRDEIVGCEQRAMQRAREKYRAEVATQGIVGTPIDEPRNTSENWANYAAMKETLGGLF